MGARIAYVKSESGELRIHSVVFGGAWNGTDEDFGLLGELDDVKAIVLIGKPSIRDQSLKMLRIKRPDIEVRRRSLVRFGVSVKPIDDGCEVVAILPESPAAFAGIEENDVIMKIDGRATPDFESIIAILVPKRPGDSISVELHREGVLSTKTVKLDKWPGDAEKEKKG